MIRTERILGIWEKSPYLEPLPEQIKELITVSYLPKKKQELSAGTVAYIQNFKQKLVPVLESSFFRVSVKGIPARQLLQKVELKVVRNVLLIFYLGTMDAAGEFDHLNYSEWHKRNLVAAFFAHHIARNQPAIQPEEACLFTYLQDISLVYLSRSLPEIYSRLVHLLSNPHYRVKEELGIVETDHAALSALILGEWGIPEEHLAALRLHHHPQDLQREENAVMRMGHLLRLSQHLADLLLGIPGSVDYHKIENQFNQFLKIAPATLQQYLVDYLKKLPELGEIFGYPELSNLTLIRVLQSNEEFLRKKIIPYEQLLEEIVQSRDRIHELEKEIRYLREQIREKSFLDSVTGIYNYSYVYEALNREISKAARYEYPITFILFDVDDFTLFNRVYGPRSGDRLLRQIAHRVKENVRKSDIFGRWNSDRYALILPHTGQPQAHFVAQKICRVIAEKPFPDEEVNRQYSITVSMGVITSIPSVYYLQRDVIIQKAEEALNKIRARGGNGWLDVNGESGYN